jgi:hypothetical protein
MTSLAVRFNFESCFYQSQMHANRAAHPRT